MLKSPSKSKSKLKDKKVHFEENHQPLRQTDRVQIPHDRGGPHTDLQYNCHKLLHVAEKDCDGAGRVAQAQNHEGIEKAVAAVREVVGMQHLVLYYTVKEGCEVSKDELSSVNWLPADLQLLEEF